MPNIKKIVIKSFNIKPEEYKKFILLFFHSFFIGLFIAFYFVQANSAFLSNYESEKLPIAYIVAGAVGYFISWIYSIFQKKVKSKYLFGGVLLFMFIITMIGRLGFNFFEEKNLSFFIFIWAWPFISLAGIESGGLAIKLLNLIQVKRLFGLINMGGVIASILGYLLIPFLTKVIGTSYNLLFGAAFSLLGAIILLYFIYKNFPEKERVVKTTKKQDTGFKTLLKEKYFRLIFLSATISMTVIYITDFGFLSSVNIQKDLFPTAASIASFFALVFASLKIGELLISYLSSRILSKYGVKLGLTIMPLMLTLIVLTSMIVGFTLGTMSLIFLGLMVLNKSMERILRRGLDDPAFNILYQPLPSSLQMAVQAKVGIVMQFAIAIAGVLLFGLNWVLKLGNGFKLEFFPIFFVPILLIWVVVAWRLYLAYKDKLREILRELGKKKQRETSKYLYGTEVLTKKFKKFNDNVVNLSVTILAETNPRIFEPYISSLLKKNDPIIVKAILRSIDPTWRTRILKQIQKIYETEDSIEIKKLAERAKNMLDFTEIKELKEENIDELIKSKSKKDKIKLIKYITKNSRTKNAERIILHLFTIEGRAIINATIKLSVHYKTEKIILKLIELLKSPIFYHSSTAALLDIGERTLPYLKKLLDKTVDRKIILKIIEIYAKMGSTPAKSAIVELLSYPNRKVQLNAIWALYYCKYQAPEDEIEIIKNKILEITSNLLWLFVATDTIGDEKNTLKLFLALDQEKIDSYELLFNLLSFLHDPRVINLIKKNIIGKNTIYALELVDNFIMQELKPYVVPIFDDITTGAKIKKLSKFFPIKAMTFRDNLREIIMHDYDKHDSWTIAKTLEMMEKIHKNKIKREDSQQGKMTFTDIPLWTKEHTMPVLNQIKKSELPDEVILCLFSCDELVYSMAGKIVYNDNPIKCAEYLKDTSDKKKSLISTLENRGYLIQDKIKLLKKYQLFFSIPDAQLLSLAKIIEPVILKKNDKIYFNENDSENIFIILRGSLISQEIDSKFERFSKKVILTPGMNIDDEINYLVAESKTTILKVDRHEYFNLLLDKTEILQHIFDAIQK